MYEKKASDVTVFAWIPANNGVLQFDEAEVL